MSKLLDFVSQYNIHTVLLDAAGTIYDDKGPYDGVVEALHTLQDDGVNFLLATNNTTTSLPGIKAYMANFGIEMEEDHIISSGLVLRDVPYLRERVSGKKVLVVGSEGSRQYVSLADGVIVESVADAEVIVFASSFPTGNNVWITSIAEEWRQRPDLDLICINPDRYVQHQNAAYPVIGFYVDRFIEETGANVEFVGKPDRSFSILVENHLKSLDIPMNDRVIFCDDNPYNIRQMSIDLPLKAIHLRDTGLSFDSVDFGLQYQWAGLI